MSLLTFIENIGTYVSAAEAAYNAVENVLPELETEEAQVVAQLQPAIAALQASFKSIEAANGFVEKVEDLPSFLGKCIALVTAAATAEVEVAGSQAFADAKAVVDTLVTDVEALIGTASSKAAAVTTVTGGSSDDTATLNSEAAAASS